MKHKDIDQFKFSPEEVANLKSEIMAFFADELEMEIGDLKADLIVKFLNKEIGKKYYNLGVAQAMESMRERVADLVMLLKD